MDVDSDTKGNPMKVVHCRDVGVDCEFVARGESVDDVLRQCGEHARSAHGYADVAAELEDKVKAAIRDEDPQAPELRIGGSSQTYFGACPDYDVLRREPRNSVNRPPLSNI